MIKKLSKHIFSLLFLVVIGILAVGSTDSESDTKEVKSQKPSYTLTATQLYKEYNANEVSADSKYKDKIVIISGKITDIGKDILDEAYIVVGGSGLLDGIQCMFTKDQQSFVKNLSKGQGVKVKGKVKGKLGNVLVKNCTLVK